MILWDVPENIWIIHLRIIYEVLLKPLAYFADVCYTMVRITDEYIRQAVKCILGDKTNDNENMQTDNINKSKNPDNSMVLCCWDTNRNISCSVNDVFRRG